MLKWLFTTLAVVSLTVCALTVAAWLDMPGRPNWKLTTLHRYYTLRATSDSLVLRVEGGSVMPNGAFRAPPGTHWDTAWANPTISLGLGIRYGRSPANDPKAAPFFGLVLPFLLVVAATTILPLIWSALLFRGYRKRRQKLQGLCPVCGYDLRATPDHCPECGTVPELASLPKS
jgi:hypothetical protein